MDEKSKSEMIRFYSALLAEHGPTKEALVYKDDVQQYSRYAALTSIEHIPGNSSVLDVGCGLGFLSEYLRGHGWKGKYTGVDINPDMIAAAKNRLPKENFICVDILEQGFDDSFDYVFCGATVQHGPKFADPEQYLFAMVRKMFALANRGLAFDVFSDRVDFTNPNMLYVDPMKLLAFCYTLTTRLVLRNDCRPYEIMVYLFNQESKDELNIYSDWKIPDPVFI